MQNKTEDPRNRNSSNEGVKRLTLVLALIAALSSSTLVVQQWRWSGQNPHKTLDFEKALLVINDPKETATKRNTASLYLYGKVLAGIDAMKGFERAAGSKYRKGLETARKGISRRALGK